MNEDKACGESPDTNPWPTSDKSLPPETDSPRIFDSEELLGGRQEILIRHHGEIYRLRLTRNDKLILNK
jgi:hemin uptake protein HemP